MLRMLFRANVVGRSGRYYNILQVPFHSEDMSECVQQCIHLSTSLEPRILDVLIRFLAFVVYHGLVELKISKQINLIAFWGADHKGC